MSESSTERKDKASIGKQRSLSAREQERRKARQQKYLNALDDLATLRDHYKKELHKKLEEKVNQQRAIMRKKKKEEQKKMEKQEASSQSISTSTASFPSWKREDDNAFLSQVKVTQIHRILKIQSILEKQGQLKYKTDEDELWNILCVPDNLRILEKEISKDTDIVLSVRRIKQMLKEAKRSMGNQLSQIEEDANESDPNRPPGKPKVAFQSKLCSEVSAERIERLLPRVQPPKFQVLFKEIITWRNPNEGRLHQMVEERRQRRLHKQQKMKEMYDHSTSYRTVTGRLLKKYGMGPYDTARNMVTFSESEDILTPLPQQETEVKLLSEQAKKKPSQRKEEERFNWVLMDEAERRITTRPDLFPKIKSPLNDDRMPSALTLEAVEEKSVVRVTKQLSQMWVNPKR